MKINKVRKKRIYLDTETTGLNRWRGARAFMVSWVWEDGKPGYCRWQVDPFTRKVFVNPKDVKMLSEICKNPKIIKTFHNAKFDIGMLRAAGVDFPIIPENIDDTSIALRILYTNLMTYSLKPTCKKLFGFSDEDEKDLKKKTITLRRQKKKIGWNLGENVEEDYWLCPDDIVAKYACNDVLRTRELWEATSELIKEDPTDWMIYEKEMRKLFPIVFEMEEKGLFIGNELVDSEIVRFKKLKKEEEARLIKLVGENVNLNSPKQLQDLFYKKFKFPIVMRTETGQPATNQHAILKLQKQGVDHPFFKSFMNFKAYEKMLDSFFGKYKELSSPSQYPEYSVVHPNFKQTDTKTGRFACAEPNLQNVPNANGGRSAVPITARNAFNPRPGMSWLLFDYSQLENWIFANVSEDKLMLNALIGGHDLHTETANKIWGKGEDIVAKEAAEGRKNTRNRAKLMLFGKVYGMGVGGAMDLIQCTKTEAQKYLKDFDDAFPGIKTYMESISREALEYGYIRNCYGRRYRVDPQMTYRACNYMVQGSAADLVKEKMIEIDNYLKKKKIAGSIVLTIHDEIVLEIPNRYANRTFARKICDIMADHHGVFKHIPKLKVNCDIVRPGKNWGEKQSLM